MAEPAWGFEVDDIGGNSGGSVTTKEQARVCRVDKAHDPHGDDQHAQHGDRNVDTTLSFARCHLLAHEREHKRNRHHPKQRMIFLSHQILKMKL